MVWFSMEQFNAYEDYYGNLLFAAYGWGTSRIELIP